MVKKNPKGEEPGVGLPEGKAEKENAKDKEER